MKEYPLENIKYHTNKSLSYNLARNHNLTNFSKILLISFKIYRKNSSNQIFLQTSGLTTITSNDDNRFT